MGRNNVKAFLERIRSRKNENFKHLQGLCKKGSNINVEKNQLIIGLTKIYGDMYVESKKRFHHFSTYLKKKTNADLTPRISRIFNLLFANFETIDYFLTNSIHFPQSYDLSEEPFYDFILLTTNSDVSVSEGDEEHHDDSENREPKRKKQKLQNKPEINPFDDDIDYTSAPYNLPIPSKDKTFLISILGLRTFGGHQKELKKIKKSNTEYVWPKDHGQALVGTNPYHFKSDGVPIETKHGIENFLSPISQKMVENFSHTFNPYWRTNIERQRRVEKVFVARNWLHGRPGVGFFCLLDDKTIFHTCCGKGCDKNMINNYKP